MTYGEAKAAFRAARDAAGKPAWFNGIAIGRDSPEPDGWFVAVRVDPAYTGPLPTLPAGARYERRGIAHALDAASPAAWLEAELDKTNRKMFKDANLTAGARVETCEACAKSEYGCREHAGTGYGR